MKKIIMIFVILISVFMILNIRSIDLAINYNKKETAKSNTNYDKEQTIMFKKCINIGNALDAPKNQPWDVKMKFEYFDAIQDAGFDSVRIPVRFSDYAKNSENYILEEDFMKELDSYVNYAINKGLVVILDFHHFTEIMDEPEKYKKCFFSVWSQLGERYKDYSNKLVFELLNEPRHNLKGDIWNGLIDGAVKEIRKTNKDRTIIVGPDSDYSIYRLEALSLPKDKNIVVSFHYYEPSDFAFQGNVDIEGDFKNLKNISWNGSNEEMEYLKSRFEIAEKWADTNNVEIFLGEFGASKTVPAESRKLWTEAVRKEAERRGFGWAYWELCSGFGIYNPTTSTWNEDLLNALVLDEK